MRSLLVCVCVAGLALRGRDVEDPLATITACEADVKEVERVVAEATKLAEDAAVALKAEEKALTGLQAGKAEVEVKLEEESAELAKEAQSLTDLETAVSSFGAALEARRQMLQAQTAEVDEKEALRMAYVEVVTQSSAEVAQLAGGNFEGEDGMVAQQRLEVKQSKLAEEKERLKTLEADVTAALARIEKQTQLYVGDAARHTAFKAALEDKIALKAKLTVSVENLMAEADALREKVDAAHGDSGDAKSEVSEREEALRDAVNKLVQEQGEAFDLLKQSLEACSVREKKPPSDTEALEVVQDSVGAAVSDSLKDFVEALGEANDGKTPSAETPAAPKSDVQGTLEALKEHLGGDDATPAPASMHETLSALKEHLTADPVALAAKTGSDVPVPKKDGMLRALVSHQ